MPKFAMCSCSRRAQTSQSQTLADAPVIFVAPFCRSVKCSDPPTKSDIHRKTLLLNWCLFWSRLCSGNRKIQRFANILCNYTPFLPEPRAHTLQPRSFVAEFLFASSNRLEKYSAAAYRIHAKHARKPKHCVMLRQQFAESSRSGQIEADMQGPYDFKGTRVCRERGSCKMVPKFFV